MTWFEDSQVWGDSIRVRSRDRSPDTVFVRGSGFTAQRDSVLGRIQQLKAETITAFFGGDALHRIRARPNARAIRFLAAENDSLNGAARTSGDRIDLRFVDGRVERVSVIGGTQTTYYRENANIPDPFELEGFQWAPDRRPRQADLLRDARVRRWLGPDSSRRGRPVAGRGTPPYPGRGAERAPDASGGRQPGQWAAGDPSLTLPWQDAPWDYPSSDTAGSGVAAPPDFLRPTSRPTQSVDTTNTTSTPDP
jgi:hypothetical protein